MFYTKNLYPKISDKGDNILRKTGRALAETVNFWNVFSLFPLILLKCINILGRNLLYQKFTQSVLVQNVVCIVLLLIICATLFVRGWKGSTVCLPPVAFLLVFHRKVDSVRNWAPNSNRTWDMCRPWGQPPHPPGTENLQIGLKISTSLTTPSLPASNTEPLTSSPNCS